MSDINNLKNKILEEAEINKQNIIKNAGEEAAKIIEKKVSETKVREKEIIEKAKLEAVSKKERIISNAQLKIRDEKLTVKQYVIEEVFNESLNKLYSLSKEQYLKFFIEKISNLNIIGDEKVIISNKDREVISTEVLKAINENLISKGKKGNLTLSNETREFTGGFIIEKNGIEINSTFEALISSMRDDLEYEVARVLFN
ncbi:MAG: V-type ATP synthase subunit E family protein [Clostridiaceae bacterium]